MAASIIETIQRLGTVIIVAPITLFALDLLAGGNVATGGAFLGIAALILLISEYVKSPTDVPASMAQRVVGRVAKPPEDDD